MRAISTSARTPLVGIGGRAYGVGMRFWRALMVVLSIVVGFVRTAHADADSFVFHPPVGFVDVSSGQPVDTSAIRAAAVAEGRSGKYAMFAVDPVQVNGFQANFNAIVKSGTGRIEQSTLDGMVKELEGIGTVRLGARAKVLEQGLFTLNGAQVARIVYDLDMDGVEMRGLQYAVPGKKDLAVLTYTSSRGDFAAKVALFEASAKATYGIDDPRKRLPFRLMIYVAVLGVVVGGALLISKLQSERKWRAIQRSRQ